MQHLLIELLFGEVFNMRPDGFMDFSTTFPTNPVAYDDITLLSTASARRPISVILTEPVKFRSASDTPSKGVSGA